MHSRLAGPAPQVAAVESVVLGVDDPEDVGPLTVGNLSVDLVLLELPQHGVFG